MIISSWKNAFCRKNVPRVDIIFYLKPVVSPSPLNDPAIVFLLHCARFLSQRTTESPQKGGEVHTKNIGSLQSRICERIERRFAYSLH